MSEDLFRERLAERHQEDRPVDRVESRDVLADDVNVARPVFFVFFVLFVGRVAERRDVVCQRVEPDVDDVFRIKLDGDAPLERRARNAEILKSRLDEIVYHLAADVFRRDEIGIFLEELEEPVLIFAHFEVVRFLFRPDERPAAVGANAAIGLRVGEERLARNAVPAFVEILVNVALLVELREYFLNGRDVIIVRRSDKMRVRRAEQGTDRLDLRRNVVDVLLRRNTRVVRVIFDLLTVLVCARTEENVVSRRAFVTRYDVGGNDVVRVSDMRLARRVCDRRRDIKFTLVFHY